MINEYHLTLFIREDSGYYRKQEETHYQRAYPLDTVRRLVEQSGLQLLHMYDAFTHEPAGPRSERVHVICRRRMPVSGAKKEPICAAGIGIAENGRQAEGTGNR